MKTAEIELTYPELSFITDIDNAEAKEIFLEELKSEKVTTKQVITVGRLTQYFDKVKSVDARYDGQNKLIFSLDHKAGNYKKYLSDKPSIKNKAFTATLSTNIIFLFECTIYIIEFFLCLPLVNNSETNF